MSENEIRRFKEKTQGDWVVRILSTAILAMSAYAMIFISDPSTYNPGKFTLLNEAFLYAVFTMTAAIAGIFVLVSWGPSVKREEHK